MFMNFFKTIKYKYKKQLRLLITKITELLNFLH